MLEPIRRTAVSTIQAAERTALANKADVSQKYAAALTGLEKSLAAGGQLDAIIRVREERDAVLKSGGTTAHNDKLLVELRSKYEKSVQLIDGGLKTLREKVITGAGAKIREQETALTKAGKVDEAHGLRKEGQKFIMELSGGKVKEADTIPFTEDPRLGEAPEIKPLKPISVPEEKPGENPFANAFTQKGRWLESLSVPMAKQRIREPIVIGDRAQKKWPLIVVAPGSLWSGSERGRIELSAANFVADKCRFASLELGSDHACFYFFRNSSFTDCKFKKVGVWYGGDQAVHFYLEKCYVKGSFGNSLNVVDIGLRVENCVFEDRRRWSSRRLLCWRS